MNSDKRSDKLPSPVMIARASDLRNLATRLQKEPLIAVDTESNSLYAYREEVCLMQISTRSTDYIVDTLALDDLSPLAPIFASPEIEKVFHAAEYDVMCLKRDHDFKFANLFDTMVAARVIGHKAFGLGNMLEEFFGVQVDKRYQRANWSLRPLPLDQIRYAQHDTHYLLPLRDILMALMEEKDCLVEAREIFEMITHVPPAVHTFDPDGFWRLNAARELTLRQMAILRELYLLRDQMAKKRNRPPFKIMGDEALTILAKKAPQELDELYDIHGLNRGLLDHHAASILQAIKRGKTGRIPSRPEQAPRMDQDTLERFERLHQWRKARAAERGVESDVIIAKEALWAIARRSPKSLEELQKVPGLGPWKIEKYGEELLNLIANSEG